MSLGLKEVLSIDTDFVSKKDKKPEGNDKPDKPFSEMNDSEIKKAAEVLLFGNEKNKILGATKVEDLSKEAQTIFSDIVAWMLERKMRDHEGAIATDNENAEWRESLAELTASVVSTARSFEPFFQNKEHRTEYRKRFLNEKISLLECYEDIVLAPLKGAIQKRDIDKKEVEKLANDISENNQKLETKTLELDSTISTTIAKKIDEQLVGEEINSFKKHIEDLKKQSEEDNKVLVELEKELKLDQDNITSIEAIIETNPAGTPWKEERLPKNSGSNTIYKIEYVLGGGEPPIVIEEFSYPIQKSVRSRNSAVAKRLILLLLAQKPVEDDKVLEARKDVEKAKKELEEAKNESNVQPGQQPSEISNKTEALKEAEENLDEAKVAAKENENKLYKNAPIGVEVVKQVAFLGKTITRVIKTSQTSSNGRKKRAFARAADCYGAIPVVLGATLANLEAGFKFNRDKQREAIE